MLTRQLYSPDLDRLAPEPTLLFGLEVHQATLGVSLVLAVGLGVDGGCHVCRGDSLPDEVEDGEKCILENTEHMTQAAIVNEEERA